MAATTFARAFPAIAWWTVNQGWIEVGYDERNQSYVRGLDPGGMVWEGEHRYGSLDDALAALEAGLAAYIRDELGVDVDR